VETQDKREIQKMMRMIHRITAQCTRFPEIGFCTLELKTFEFN